MKEIFKTILYGAPLAAIVLYFSLTGKEEIKAEQRIREATHAVESQKFDDDFADAFNNTPTPGAGAQVQKTRAANLADLEKKAAEARAKRDELDTMYSQTTKDMGAAISEADAQALKDFSLDGKAPALRENGRVTK